MCVNLPTTGLRRRALVQRRRALRCGAGLPGGSAPDCNDGIGCTKDNCNEAADTCNHVPDDSACDDGQPCTLDRCEVELGCLNVEDPQCGKGPQIDCRANLRAAVGQPYQVDQDGGWRPAKRAIWWTKLEGRRV